MTRAAKNRVGMLAVVGAVVALGLGTTGVFAAGAAPSNATGGRGAASGEQVAHSLSALGTYEWFISGRDSGEITLTADGAWSSARYSDAGSWVTQRGTIAMSDSSDAQVWIATVEKHGLSSARHLGTWVEANVPQAGTWYAIKVS
jgi:hypothetical protein